MKKYIFFGFGEVKGLLSILKKLPVTNATIIDSGGLFLSCFESDSSLDEIYELIKEPLTKYSYSLDYYTPGQTKFSLVDSKILNNLLTAYASDSEISQSENTEIDIHKLTPKEKEEWTDRILEKGVENITDDDKKLLRLLTN